MTATTPPTRVLGRPGLLRTLWRVAVSVRKRPGPDAGRALGLPLRAGPIRVEADELASYRAICDFAPGREAPITFPHMLAFPLHTRVMARDDFPFPLMGAIHLENTIEMHAPIGIGDALGIEVRPTALFRHGKGQVVELTTRAERDGACVWQSRSLYLFREAAQAVGSAYEAARIEDAQSMQEQGAWALPVSIGRRYAMVSGDWNPIHISRPTARMFGLRKSIAHGMLLKARAIAAVSSASERIASVTVAFRTPAFLPGGARVFAGRGERGRIFEVRDASSPRKLLRGRVLFAG